MFVLRQDGRPVSRVSANLNVQDHKMKLYIPIAPAHDTNSFVLYAYLPISSNSAVELPSKEYR
jgi:hypothetical protein